MKSELLSDKRKISGIYKGTDDNEQGWTVGRGGVGNSTVDAIEVYAEPGIGCDLPFFRVVCRGFILARVPAYSWDVVYAKESDDA